MNSACGGSCLFWAFLMFVLLACFAIEQTTVAVRVHRKVVGQNAIQTQVSKTQITQLTQYIAVLEATELGVEVDDGNPYQRTVLHTEEDRQNELFLAKRELQWHQTAMAQSQVVQQPIWRAIFEAVCLPWRWPQSGSHPDGLWPVALSGASNASFSAL